MLISSGLNSDLKPDTKNNKLESWCVRLISIILLCVLFSDITGNFAQNALLNVASKLGYQQSPQSSLINTIKNAPWENYFSSKNQLPQISIDIKFKHLKKLYKKRKTAFLNGVLESSKDDFIPATIHTKNKSIKVKLRLKGDQPRNHLSGNKWSFRIHTKNKDHLFGMRRFSIQHPQTRGYHGEVFFHKTLDYLGILHPRYFFIEVIINGENIGIMAVEEHFSKELLEFNQKKEGVIVRFDESLIWKKNKSYETGFYGALDKYSNTPLDAFRSTKIKQSERLSKEYNIAISLLRSFIHGHKKASEVFDAELTGKYFAATEFWGVWHDARWHNLRFYLNPYTLKLEPISYDASFHERAPVGSSVLFWPFSKKVMSDPVIRTVVNKTLTELANDIKDGALLAPLKRVEKKYRKQLQQEFILLPKFDFSEAINRAKTLPKYSALVSTDLQIQPQINPPDYPIHIHAYLNIDSRQQYLEVLNALPYEIEITKIYWQDHSGRQYPFVLEKPSSLPLSINKTDLLAVPYPHKFDISIIINSVHKLIIETKIKGYPDIKKTIATQVIPTSKISLSPQSSIKTQLALHSFLKQPSANKKTLLIKQGTWTVNHDIIIPHDFELIILPATTLKFTEKSAFISYGNTLLQGTKKHPVILENALPDSTWQGISLFKAPGVSEWNYVTVKNTQGINKEFWSLSGGVNIYRSNIHLNHCTFDGSESDDAVNIVHSKLELTDIAIKNTRGDGLDIDFSNGRITGGSFNNIGVTHGGDAIDTSGSNISIKNITFDNISDKSISAGEKSMVNIDQIQSTNSKIAIASKDDSHVILTNSTIKQYQLAALMSYVKKPEYKPASLIADNNIIQDKHHPFKVQHGSQLIVNGVQIETETLDLDKLYQ